MDVIHSNINDDSHLQGMTSEEVNIIRKLASVYVNAIVKMADEKTKESK